MTAFTYRMPAGIPGDVSRDHAQATIEAGLMDADTPFPAYGLPAKLSSGKYVPLGAGSDADDLVGFLVRPYPTGATSSDGLGTSTPPQDGSIGNIMKRGYMAVKLNGGATVAKGDPVYVRVANSSEGKPVGGIEGAPDDGVTATADDGNNGNGTVGTMSATAAAKVGAYQVKFTAATAFNVFDPDGREMQPGSTGTAYSAGGLGFTITAGGTAFEAGDSFAIVNAPDAIPLPLTRFTGAADGNGIVEIAYNI
jgi:hypothetical protein